MRPSHSRALVASALGAGVALAIALWAVGLVVARRAERTLERAGGGRASVEGASLGLESVTLRGLSLERTDGVAVAVDRVVVEGPVLALATAGLRAVRGVQLEGARAQVDLEAFRAARQADAGPAAAPAAPAGPRAAVGAIPVRVRDGRLEVRDAHGVLLRLEGATLTLAPAAVEVAAREVRLGGEQGERVTAEDVTAVLRREPLALVSGGVGALHVVVASARGAGPSLRRRLLGAARRPADGAAAPEGGDGRARGPADWLAPGAGLHVSRAQVASLRAGTERPLMEDLTASLSRGPEGAVHTRGSGGTAEGGRIAWRFALERPGEPPAGEVTFERLPLSFLLPLLPELPIADADEARVDASLRLEVVEGDRGRVAVAGRLAVTQLTLEAPALSSSPVRDVAFALEGRGTYARQDHDLRIDEGALRLRDAEVRVQGRLAFPGDDVVVEASAVLPPTPCDAAVHAIPRDALGDYVGFALDGQLAGRLELVADTRDPSRARVDVDVADGCRFEVVPAAADLRRFRGPFVHRVREPEGQWFETTTGPGTGHWVSIHRVSPYLVHAVLAHEDGGFFDHPGFAEWAIEGALERNLRAGRVVWGGSTITMQLAKNLFLERERTLVRKVQEVLLTWWLEKSLPKLDLLELYLNVIEYAPGVYGLRDAAWHYFRRHPDELSPAESAFLACVLPGPKKYQRSYEQGALTPSLADRVARLLRHMHDRGRIDAAALEAGLAELPTFRFADPATDERAAPRPLPAGAAPIPGMASDPALWGASPSGLGGGSPFDLDAPPEDDQP